MAKSTIELILSSPSGSPASVTQGRGLYSNRESYISTTLLFLFSDDRMSIFAWWFERDSVGCHTAPINTIEQGMCA